MPVGVDVVLIVLPCLPVLFVVFRYSARGELVTPTGAALVRVLSSEFGRPPLFVPQAIGEKPMIGYFLFAVMWVHGRWVLARYGNGGT